MKPLTIDQLENIGSLITIKGTNDCLGDLVHFEGGGTCCASYGLVPVTKEQADAHNKCLAEANLKGMDENRQVGQGGYAYWNQNRGVSTFTGLLIAPRTNCSVKGQSITFTRANKKYRGRLGKHMDVFNFRRVA